MARHLLGLLLGLLLVVNLATAGQWNYEFGERQPNDLLIYEREGIYRRGDLYNPFAIRVDMGVDLSHVKLTLWTDMKPIVDFNWEIAEFHIEYYVPPQITTVRYKIEAHAVVPHPDSSQSG